MPKVKCPKHGKAMRLEYPNPDGGWFYSCPSCQPMYLVGKGPVANEAGGDS